MSRLDEYLENYRRLSPTKNLEFLESQVQSRLGQVPASRGFFAFLTAGFAEMPVRFAAVALAVFMGTGFGMLPNDTVSRQNDFNIFSDHAPYLPSTLLSRPQ